MCRYDNTDARCLCMHVTFFGKLLFILRGCCPNKRHLCKKKIKVTLMCIIEYSVSASLSAEMQVFVLYSFCEKSGISASSVKSVPSKYSVSVSVSTEMQCTRTLHSVKKKSCIGECPSQNDIEPCPQQKYSTNRKSKQHSISLQQWLTDPQKFF